MAGREYVFEVHYGGQINRRFMCTYVGGEVDVYKEKYDADNLSFFEIERIVKTYGYKPGDLVYYLVPGSSMQSGLQLISSDHDVVNMVEVHQDVPVIELYLVSFAERTSNENDYLVDDEAEETEADGNGRIDRDDPYWDEVNEPDLFDEDNEVDRPSTQGGGEGEGGEGGEGDESDEDFEQGSEDSVEESEDAGDKLFEGGNTAGYDDGQDSDMARSDILTSPPNSDEECEVVSQPACKPRHSEFHPSDLHNPQLCVGQKFPSIKLFREAVRDNNLRKGKDVFFKKNYLARCIVVCRDPGCKYRVYGRKCRDEESFEIRSYQPKHKCTRRHKNTIVKSTWIANKLLEKFRAQPNMPLTAMQGEVKDKWGVDTPKAVLYRARRLAKVAIQGKVKVQYNRLWDYCETVRVTNVGSCVLMMVERPLPDCPAKFQRLYFSLAAMKRGFLAGCRPIIGLDGCFLKGPFKGQLLSATSRDGNNNMYPVAFAVVEAKVKDSWTWFLSTLLSDLGRPRPPAQEWTFISDRQKVMILYQFFFFFLLCFVLYWI
jgi:hypothetical protein